MIDIDKVEETVEDDFIKENKGENGEIEDL
jgi:hypothetical protein